MNQILYIIISILLISNIFLIYKLYKKSVDYKKNVHELNKYQEKLIFVKNDLSNYKKQIKIYQERNMKINSFNNKKYALVGDYIKDSANNTLKVLEESGFIVDVVNSGLEIIDRIKNNHNYDIIFTNNIYEKSFDGPTVLDELKGIKDFNTPVVILTSSQNQRHYFVDVLNFDEYIEKPLDQEKLKPILKKFF